MLLSSMRAKGLLKNKTTFCVVLLFVLFFGYKNASAATLQINSNASTMAPGGTATLYVVLNSEGVAINNAEAVINFSTEFFDVLSVNKSGSIFSLWVEDPSFSNSAGTVTFNGGIPTPGFNGGAGNVVSFTVRAKKAGQANFTFSSAAIRANDGLGTDVLRSQTGKTINIAQAEAPKLAVENTPTADTSVVPALEIISLTHPDQGKWYKNRDAVFKWLLPKGIDAVQTTVDNYPTANTHVTYSPAIKEKSIPNLKDDTWYFKVRARKAGKWGPTSVYIVRVDATVPVKKEVSFVYDNINRTLDITADITDATSGLERYDVYVNDVLVKSIPFSEFINNNYKLPFDNVGENNVKLLAIDKAGNTLEVSGVFTVEEAILEDSLQVDPLVLDIPSFEEGEESSPIMLTIGTFSMVASYAIAILALLVLLLTIGAYYLGYRARTYRPKSKIRKMLNKGETVAVLGLLRKRLENHLEILQNTRHNRLLSKEEKAIKEAIEADLDEVDETLEDYKEKQEA